MFVALHNGLQQILSNCITTLIITYKGQRLKVKVNVFWESISSFIGFFDTAIFVSVQYRKILHTFIT